MILTLYKKNDTDIILVLADLLTNAQAFNLALIVIRNKITHILIQ